MFVFNFKLAPSKKLSAFFAAASVAVAVICIICMISVQNKPLVSATCDELGRYSLKCENSEEEIKFLEQFGLTPDKLDDRSKVVIPAEFNDTYKAYNELQKEAGLDLEKFKGKTAEKITYRLRNSKAKSAVILIYKGNAIGGHITNGEYGSKNMPLV